MTGKQRGAMLFVFPLNIAQMVAWKWEWQGSVAALTACLAAAIFRLSRKLSSKA
jgi:hypothetical protein